MTCPWRGLRIRRRWLGDACGQAARSVGSPQDPADGPRTGPARNEDVRGVESMVRTTIRGDARFGGAEARTTAAIAAPAWHLLATEAAGPRSRWRSVVALHRTCGRADRASASSVADHRLIDSAADAGYGGCRSLTEDASIPDRPHGRHAGPGGWRSSARSLPTGRSLSPRCDPPLDQGVVVPAQPPAMRDVSRQRLAPPCSFGRNLPP